MTKMMGSVGSGQFRATRKKTGVTHPLQRPGGGPLANSGGMRYIECCMPRDVMARDMGPARATGRRYSVLGVTRSCSPHP